MRIYPINVCWIGVSWSKAPIRSLRQPAISDYVNFPSLSSLTWHFTKKHTYTHILSVVFTLRNIIEPKQNYTFLAFSFHKVWIPHFDHGIQGSLKSESYQSLHPPLLHLFTTWFLPTQHHSLLLKQPVPGFLNHTDCSVWNVFHPFGSQILVFL